MSVNPRVEGFTSKLDNVIEEAKQMLFITRGIEFHYEMYERLEVVKKELNELKQEMIALGEEDDANMLLSFDNILSAFSEELQMWINLKEDDPNSAWDNLINAQEHTVIAIRAHPIAENLGSHMKRLSILENELFPPQVFVSASMVIGKSICSICGEESGECDHLPGRPYMGEMCTYIIEEIVSADHVAIVENPASKRCRILGFNSEDGETIDRMTLRVKRDNDE